MLEFITLMAIFLVTYHHVIYPMFLRLLRPNNIIEQAPPQRNFRAQDEDQHLPRIELIIPAFNEAKYMADKINMVSALDYPADKLKIIIACDGCTDLTAAIARRQLKQLSYCEFDIELVEHKCNRGKVALLNEHIRQSRAEIIALSDVSALISVDALLIAANHFKNQQVGVVCGTYHILNYGSEGEKKYWQYQRQIKQSEAALGAMLGAHGAFYLFRRNAFKPLKADTINDDFILPMTILSAGYKAVYEPEICALELEQANNSQDRNRRQRIGAGNMQQLIRLRHLLLPKFKGLAFTFFSSKVLRVLTPAFMMLSLMGSALLAQSSAFFLILLILQLSGYALAALPRCFSNIQWPSPVQSLNYLVEGHLASFAGGVGYGLSRSEKKLFWRSQHPMVSCCKRVFDLVTASLLIVMTLPIMIITAIAIKLDSPGPVFYRQLRVGRMSQQYTELVELVKFRSMKQEAETATGAVWARAGDLRVTRVGRFIRATRIDELPQLFLVLKGDLSLVGPRPERPEFYRELERALPYYSERTFALKPGITGLAQVKMGYGNSLLDTEAKLLFDHSYAASLANFSAWIQMEFNIVCRTVWVVVARKGI